MNGRRWPIIVLGAVLSAHVAAANDLDQTPRLEALLVGEMSKLQVGTRSITNVPFTTADGTSTTLAAFEGKHLLVNFWAPWCAPCRLEMPHLSALQEELGDDTFEVVTIAVGQNRPDTMSRFLSEIGADNLPLHTDPTSRLSGDMAVLGLPATVLVHSEGREIARMLGAADWTSPDAIALIKHIFDQ